MFRIEDRHVGKMDLGETGCGEVNCIHLALDGDHWQAVVNA
jgi:hypothetical protein